MKKFLIRGQESGLRSLHVARIGVTVVLASIGAASSAMAAEPAPSVQSEPAPVTATGPAPVVEAAVEPAPPAPAPVATQPAPVVVAAPTPVIAPRTHRPVLRMRYREGYPIPAGYAVEEGPNRALVLGGVLAAGIPYLVGLSAALVADFGDHSGWLAIPVAGPWLMRSARGRSNDPTHALLGIDGLAQGVGVILVGVGFALTQKELVWTGLEEAWVAPKDFGRGGYGFAAGAKF